jgi:hypothetical protein
VKVKIAKNGDVIYRQGLKTLIANQDTNVNKNVFEARASFSQTIHYLLSTKAVLNFSTSVMMAASLSFIFCSLVREFRMFAGIVMKISIFAIIAFASLLVYRICGNRFWRFFKK